MAERDIEAAELALGLLDGDERAAAMRRVLADPAFAADVEWWRMQLAALFDLWPRSDAPAHLAARIEASLDARSGGMRAIGRRTPWPLLTAISSAIAACLLLFVLVDPRPSVPVSQPIPAARPTSVLVAMLDAGDTGPIASVFNPAVGSLRIAAAPVVAADRVAQLWAIGADGVPHPLALLKARTATLVLAPADRARIVAGAVLAISIEPTGGSPTGLPTGPVVAKGVLARV